MATVTKAQVEAAYGRQLTWWERIGFWWQAATAVPGTETGLAEDQNSWFYAGFTATGDVADMLSQTDAGALGADIGQFTINGAEQVSKGNPWYIAGIVGSLALAIYIWGKIT